MLATSRLNGFPTATAALSRQSEPSSPTYWRIQALAGGHCIVNSMSGPVLTLVKILAPKENPRPKSGRLGNVFLAHLGIRSAQSRSPLRKGPGQHYLTTCLTSQVARALNKTPEVTSLFAHPRPLTTQHSQPPSSSTNGAMAWRR